MSPGYLSPLPYPDGKFQALSLNFITDFPFTQGFNALLVVLDQLTKYVTLLLCAFGLDHPFGAGGMANLLVRHIVYKYGVPQSIVHNGDA